MINYLKRFFKNEEGSSIVIITIVMSVILFFTAIVIDYGFAYIKTSELQNALDSAAFAAGQKLPVDSLSSDKITEIKSIAIEYAQKNGISNLTNDDITLSDLSGGNYNSVSVTGVSNIETFFSGIINLDSFNISRSAKAKVVPTASVKDAVPLGVRMENLEQAIQNGNTQHIVLKYGSDSSTDLPSGSFGAIDLDGFRGGGANDFSLWLQYGYTSEVFAGEYLYPVETGNMAGPTETAFMERYNSCTHFSDDGGCNINHFDPLCPRVVKALVVEYVGSHFVRIRGFAAFVLEGNVLENKKSYIVGSLIKTVTRGEPSNNGLLNAADFGVYTVRLSE